MGIFRNENPTLENKQIEVGHDKKQESMLRKHWKKREREKKKKNWKKEEKRNKKKFWTISCPLVSLEEMF